MTQAIVDLTNYLRSENHLPPLVQDSRLSGAAQIHSQDMALLNTMAHTLPGTAAPGLTDRASIVHYRYTTLGENIAYNQADASSVVASWMASPPHRQNMLGSSFTDIGVGLAWNSRGEPYYTMMLGKPA
ncbi:MAG: CAP domain-containing protein [Isosphaeraceae bacterium]